MRSSLFKKYMLLSSAIILVSFVIMGAVSSYSLSQYWINDKLESMTGSAESLSSIASHRSMQTGEDSYTLVVMPNQVKRYNSLLSMSGIYRMLGGEYIQKAEELEALSVDGYYPIDLEKELQKSM